MSWLIIAIIAHFIFALVFIIDKFLLTKTVLSPVAYAFYSGILQILVLVFIPFGFAIPSVEQIIASFMAGALFVFAVLVLYYAFRINEVSKITPIVGGATPVFVLILTYFFLQERLQIDQMFAFVLLVLGGVIMLWPKKQLTIAALPETFVLRGLFLALLSAFLFAGSFVLTKFVYIYQPFINGLIWTRLGGFLAAVLLFLWPRNRQLIFDTTKVLKFKTIGVFFSNKVISAIAFILLNYAIFLGSVTLVNALQGVQYVFLLLIAALLSLKFPQILREQISRPVLFQKIMAILFIGAGLGILAL